ncbi:MAG: hypothetical protein V3U13_01440 [Gemmatimonadota bacterium]|jgi:hypothetical protein
MDDPVLIAKIIGAAVAFGLGIWIGIGTPGLKRPAQSRPWRAADRLHATWINRVFFRMERPARRLDASRLIVPKDEPEKPSGERTEGEN